MKLKNIILTGPIGLCLAVGIGFLAQGCSSNVNTNHNEHFTSDGYLVRDTTEIAFKREAPSLIKFYVEVSGSMNGFFRANRPTSFKTDVWNVLSSCSALTQNVSLLTNDGSQGMTLSLGDFRTKMNTGAFESSASTRVPLMLQTIIDNLDTEAGEVAVLISDMKYSPVGVAAPSVLMSQYSTDISEIISKFGHAVSVIGATSNYLDKGGNEQSVRSPYYFVILGKQENVAEMRNYISLLLKQKGSLVDNIESGFNYGYPEYAFGISNKCIQLSNEPTFLEYEEADEIDTCTVKLKIPLENYRWIMADENVLRDALKVKALYGSSVKVGDTNIEVKDITGSEKKLNREAIATVDLKIFNMPTDSDVIEWNLELPSTDYTLFNEFFENAVDENDPDKSYSVKEFITGIFQGGAVVHDMKPNHILISKEK